MDFNIIQGQSGTVGYSSSGTSPVLEVYSCTLSVGVSQLETGIPYTDKGLYLLRLPNNANTTTVPKLNINAVGSYSILANGSTPGANLYVQVGQLIANCWAFFLWDQSLQSGTGAFVFMGFKDIDTGWQDLSGFAFITGAPKPQYRVIGKTINFRGNAIIPLAGSGGALVNYASETSYVGQAYTTPYQGTGGVVVNRYGGLQWNYNGTAAQSVLPPGILPDGNYSRQIVGIRRILAATDTYNTITYSSWLFLNISNTGVLWVDTIFDLEEYGDSQPVGMSMMRFLTSFCTQGHASLDFTSLAGTQNSRALTIGKVYTIVEFNTGDDFLNVGASSNAVGVVFTAVGQFPNVWTNGSVLSGYANSLGSGITTSNSAGLVLQPSITTNPLLIHPVTMDAGYPSYLGGFSVTLDGLTAYIT